MAKKQFETVKLDATKVQAVRKLKEKTGVPITRFIETAIDEKVERVNSEEQTKKHGWVVSNGPGSIA